MKQIIKAFLIGACVGMIVPIACICIYRALNTTCGTEGLFIWPSWIFLMALDGQEQWSFDSTLIVISFAVNMAYYGIIGMLLYPLIRPFINKKSSNKAPQPTPFGHG
jgi:hypothetical protein